jgi:Flp pilus assembly protein TadD
MDSGMPVENAKSLIAAGRLQEAGVLLDQLLLREPGNVYARFERAKTHQLLKDEAAAEREYAKVLELDPRVKEAEIEINRLRCRRLRQDPVRPALPGQWRPAAR